jgi:hypothetical protein
MFLGADQKKHFSMDRVKMVLPEILQDSPRFHGKNPWFAAKIFPYLQLLGRESKG